MGFRAGVRSGLAVMDRLSGYAANVSRWLLPVLTVVIVYDVTLRYVFNAPTEWAFHISYMLGGSMYIFAMSYVLRIDRHVRVDLLQRRMSERTQLIIEMVLMVLLFFPLMYFLCRFSLLRTIQSWVILEKGSLGFWYPPLYPFRTVITIGLFLVFGQGIAKFVRQAFQLTKGEEL